MEADCASGIAADEWRNGGPEPTWGGLQAGIRVRLVGAWVLSARAFTVTDFEGVVGWAGCPRG